MKRQLLSAAKALSRYSNSSNYQSIKTDEKYDAIFDDMLGKGFPQDKQVILDDLLQQVREKQSMPSFDNYKIIYVWK